MKTTRNSTKLVAVLAALALVMAAVFTAAPAFAQSVTTDQPEYHPGDIVTVTGGGWTPNEYVVLSIVEDPPIHPDVTLVTVADGKGDFKNTGFSPSGADIITTFALTATGQSSGFTAQTVFADPQSLVRVSGSLCADVASHGAGVCSGLANDPAGFLGTGQTHYEQRVGTTADYQIRWLSTETPDYVAETATGTCAIDQVKVQIKSSLLGNTVICGTVDGTGKIISFSWTAPQNGCQTGPVAYKTGTNGGGGDQFSGTDNDIIKDNADDSSGNAAAGIGYVPASGPLVAISCANIATEIHDSNHTAIISAFPGDVVHDTASATGTTLGGVPQGTVIFKWFTNGICTDTPALTSSACTLSIAGTCDSDSLPFTQTPGSAGAFAFQAHYTPASGSPYDPADSPCEPLEVILPLPQTGQLKACKYEDSNANGVNDSEPALAGWSMTIDPLNDAPETQTQVTDSTGCVTWTNLTPGSYKVTEATPSGGPLWFNTDPGPLCLIAESSSMGWPTCPTPNKTDNVTEGELTTVSFGNIQSAEKHGQKFYDLNTNGTKDSEVGINGVKITLSGLAVDGQSIGPVVTFTAPNLSSIPGFYRFMELLPGNYMVAETEPNATWLPTTPLSILFELTPGEVEENNDFGNVCLGAGGGLTLGFWSNKNGQAVIYDGPMGLLTKADPELLLLSGLHLRKASGSDFDPATYSSFRSWILSATATNMAYMLSAQLAAMELNVEAGFVNGGTYVFAGTAPASCTVPGLNGAGFISISYLMNAANSSLGTYANTTAAGAARTCQEFMKNTLDKANNNLNFVQAQPCSFASPY